MKRRNNKIQKEVLGEFSVLSERQEFKRVIVCQDVKELYDGQTRHTKFFYLDSVEGKQVFPTDDPMILCLADGTLLKKRNC